MAEQPSVEHAAEQWARWCWNLSIAMGATASSGQSAEVVMEQLARALAAGLEEVVATAHDSPPAVQSFMAGALRVQAGVLERAADRIDPEATRDP